VATASAIAAGVEMGAVEAVGVTRAVGGVTMNTSMAGVTLRGVGAGGGGHKTRLGTASGGRTAAGEEAGAEGEGAGAAPAQEALACLSSCSIGCRCTAAAAALQQQTWRTRLLLLQLLWRTCSRLGPFRGQIATAAGASAEAAAAAKGGDGVGQVHMAWTGSVVTSRPVGHPAALVSQVLQEPAMQQQQGVSVSVTAVNQAVMQQHGRSSSPAGRNAAGAEEPQGVVGAALKT
jgi:hypothetical protein